jgi:hypothetical protein
MNIVWGVFFLALTLAGLYLMVAAPVSKKYQSTIYLDMGLGAFLILISLLYITFGYIIPMANEEGSTQPCGSNSPQAICYGLDTDTCERAWSSFDAACDAEAKPILEKRPSALLYPFTYKCHAQKFDKITFYNRRKSDIPFCQEYFKKIE